MMYLVLVAALWLGEASAEFTRRLHQCDPLRLDSFSLFTLGAASAKVQGGGYACALQVW